jgi:hypothetical protein
MREHTAVHAITAHYWPVSGSVLCPLHALVQGAHCWMLLHNKWCKRRMLADMVVAEPAAVYSNGAMFALMPCLL